MGTELAYKHPKGSKEVDRGVRSLIASEGQERVWTKVLTLEPGTYQYRYVVDGEWREDPANPQSAPGPTGQPNSILHVR